MNDKNLKELLNRLNDVLDETDEVDEETLALVRELDEEIHRLTEAGAASEEYEGVIDQAKSVQTRFALEYPVAERFLREIIDTLSRVGI
jgi:phosphate uptake regulator